MSTDLDLNEILQNWKEKTTNDYHASLKRRPSAMVALDEQVSRGGGWRAQVQNYLADGSLHATERYPERTQ